MYPLLDETALKTKDIVLIALFTALIVALGLIPPIPVPVVPVPITLQTLGVMLTGLILGPRRGAMVVLLYVLLALIGVPVLPGGRAGLSVLVGPTAGFLIGMIPGVVLTGWLAGTSRADAVADSNTRSIGWRIARYWLAGVAGGILVVYAVGVPWLAMVAGMGLSKAVWAMAVFLPGDVVKALLAAVVAQRLRRFVAA